LTKHFRHVIILTVNYIINLYSQLVAKRFETLYSSPSIKANMKAPKVLEHYRSVRRLLPLMSDGNHMGNHNSFATLPNGKYAKNIYGGYDSWYATQGITPSHKRMSLGKRVKLAVHDYKELLSR
jgi:hypothetical protein